MTEREICRSYREAKDKRKQIPIISDLSGLSKTEIIGILLKNGENVIKQDIEQLYKRLDTLDAQISKYEKEYKEIARVLAGKKKVDFSEKKKIDNKIKAAFTEKPDIVQYENIIEEQQRFMQALVTENLKLREKILDMVME